jgi:hypothetical protein
MSHAVRDETIWFAGVVVTIAALATKLCSSKNIQLSSNQLNNSLRDNFPFQTRRKRSFRPISNGGLF